MSDHSPEPDDDDTLADRLADALVELARRPGVQRLVAMRMAEIIDEDSPDHLVAKALGVRAYVPASIARKALAKCKADPRFSR